MKKQETLSAIRSVWLRLPLVERQTENQLVAFAIKMANDPSYSFRSSGDRYQDIMAYMSRDLTGLKKRAELKKTKPDTGS